MKKVIRLTEADLTRIVKRVMLEQMESGTDPQDPASHFGTVEKALIPKGFKKDISMLKTMGSEDLTNSGGHGGIIVRYYSPVHPESKKKGYVVELIVNNSSKKKWGQGANMYEVIKEVEKYLKPNGVNESRIVKRVLNEQESKLDLRTISDIFKSKGYNISPSSGFKLWGHKETSGPVKNVKTGQYYWNYEMYIPLKGASDEGIPGTQLWVDRRRSTENGGTESENIIIGLDGDNHIVKNKKNGKTISKSVMTTQEVINLLNGYLAKF